MLHIAQAGDVKGRIMKYAYRFLACTAVSTIFAIPPAFAHHPGIGGVGGTGGIITIGGATLNQGQFAASFYVEYLRFKQLSDSTLAANPSSGVHGLQSIESRTLALAYGISNDLMISLRMPWVRRSGIREGVQEDLADPVTINDRGSTSGFGDMTVLGQYRFLNNIATGTQVAALFGFKAPTGATNRVDPFGEIYEAEFQPGSGSWDGLFGAAMSQRLNRSWAFHANALAVFTGTGTQATNLGNRFLYNAALSYRVFGETSNEPAGYKAHAHVIPPRHSHSKAPVETKPHRDVALDTILELNGEWHDKSRTAGIADPNSGGNTIYLSPGLRLSVNNWSTYASVGVPIVADVNGTQSKSSWRMVVGVAAAFGP
jgi:hypothetical protein